MKSLVRTVVWAAVVILVMFMLAHFLPGLFWGLVGLAFMVIGGISQFSIIAQLIQAWRLGKRIGVRGLKPRAQFAFYRAFQDFFHGTYIRMVHGDDDTEPELTKAQRLKLMRHDRSITEQQLKDGLTALRTTRRASDDTTARTAPASQAPKSETVAPDRTAPRSVRMAQQARTQQPPAAPVEERHGEPVQDTEVREDETIELGEVEFDEPVPAPAPRQPRPTPRTRGTGVNSSTPSSGFGGSIRITGGWGQNKN